MFKSNPCILILALINVSNKMLFLTWGPSGSKVRDTGVGDPACHGGVVSKFGDYRNSDGISSEGKSSDYFKKKILVSANSVSIFWALKYIESKLSD